jgi:hypothetical protein
VVASAAIMVSWVEAMRLTRRFWLRRCAMVRTPIVHHTRMLKRFGS